MPIDDALKEKLCASFKHVIEPMVFNQFEPSNHVPTTSEANGLFWAKIRYKSVLSGFLVHSCNKDLIQQCHDAVFGFSSTFDVTRALDLMGEILNTHIGLFLQMACPNEAYTLSLPETGKGAIKYDDVPQFSKMMLDYEGQHYQLDFFIDPQSR